MQARRSNRVPMTSFATSIRAQNPMLGGPHIPDLTIVKRRPGSGARVISAQHAMPARLRWSKGAEVEQRFTAFYAKTAELSAIR